MEGARQEEFTLQVDQEEFTPGAEGARQEDSGVYPAGGPGGIYPGRGGSGIGAGGAGAGGAGGVFGGTCGAFGRGRMPQRQRPQISNKPFNSVIAQAQANAAFHAAQAQASAAQAAAFTTQAGQYSKSYEGDEGAYYGEQEAFKEPAINVDYGVKEQGYGAFASGAHADCDNVDVPSGSMYPGRASQLGARFRDSAFATGHRFGLDFDEEGNVLVGQPAFEPEHSAYSSPYFRVQSNPSLTESRDTTEFALLTDPEPPASKILSVFFPAGSFNPALATIVESETDPSDITIDIGKDFARPGKPIHRGGGKQAFFNAFKNAPSLIFIFMAICSWLSLGVSLVSNLAGH
eukprot:988461-Rhodomonas_salina.1